MRAAYWDDPRGRGRVAAARLAPGHEHLPVVDAAAAVAALDDDTVAVTRLECDRDGLQRDTVDALVADAGAHVVAAVELGEEPTDRWVCIRREPAAGPAAATLLFVVPRADRPGALTEILGAFSSRGRNLSRVEPRPLGGLGRFGFVLEVDGGPDEADMARALDEVARAAQRVRVLGTLPAVTSPAGALHVAAMPTATTTGATVGIVGLGLIGGSLARDLQDSGHRVVALDPAPAPVQQVAAWERIPRVGDVDALAEAADVVVVATPLGVVDDVLARLLTAAPDLVVTDVASIKRTLVATHGSAPGYVGGHPMAGTERNGFGASRPGLFDGAPWMLTPTDATSPSAFALVARLVLAVGGRPVVVTAAEHDRIVATVSHTPHLLAFGLQHLAATDERDVAELAGPSYRDATRVGASDPAFWADLVTRNGDDVRRTVAALADWLRDTAGAEREDLAVRLRESRRRARQQRLSVDEVVLDGAPAAWDRLRALGRHGHALREVTVTDGVVTATV